MMMVARDWREFESNQNFNNIREVATIRNVTATKSNVGKLQMTFSKLLEKVSERANKLLVTRIRKKNYFGI